MKFLHSFFPRDPLPDACNFTKSQISHSIENTYFIIKVGIFIKAPRYSLDGIS